MRNDLDGKILQLLRAINPDDPLEYLRDISKTFSEEKLVRSISKCNSCDICASKCKTLPRGNIKSDVLIIAEAPSNEQRNNKISGALDDQDGVTFERALGVLKADPSEMYIINAVNCFASRDGVRRQPTLREKINCSEFIGRVVEIMKPKVIICLGAVASNSISPHKIAIMEDRGKSFEYKGVAVIPTFHPGFFRESEGKFDDEIINIYKENFLDDLHVAFSIAKSLNPESKIGNIVI